MRTIFLIIVAISLPFLCIAQGNKIPVPSVYTNILHDDESSFILKDGDKEYSQADYIPRWTYSKILQDPVGTDNGIAFDFGDKDFHGIIYYGLIDMESPRYPQKIFHKRTSKIENGRASINVLRNLSGKYDLSGWQKTGELMLGYRIVNDDGLIIADARIRLKGKGPFEPVLTIKEGPFVNMLTHESVVISLKTNMNCRPEIRVAGRTVMSEFNTDRHEISIDGLLPSTKYIYEVMYGDHIESYDFTTAPAPGSREAFTFAFFSDSRNGKGGGERNIHGTNAYIMKKEMALSLYEDAAFVQFTGDMISGYLPNIDETWLQYYNWRNSIESFWHYLPVNVAPGNHEAVSLIFDDGSKYGIMVDLFPFESHSAEALFADFAVNPLNGPVSEDGSQWDPDTNKMDFPSYKENVYYYTYGNVAMVVMNSNYFYTPIVTSIPLTGGNPHGYVMDMQLQWLETTIASLEANKDIDHIFVTLHTPAFPNGGHAYDDMWYNGNNEIRPWISGKKADKGIIERRDELLDIMVNKSKKTLALLCGDEHNYTRMKIDNSTNIYPENWDGKSLNFSRSFWQLTNGAAGAPYYAQEELPWSDAVEIFSTQYALVLFHVDGKNVDIEVLNPDTLEKIEETKLR